MMKTMFAALLLIATPTIGSAENAKHDPIINFSDTDADMNAAIADANRTLPQFFERLAAPADDETGFVVKYNLTPASNAELIWAKDVAVNNGVITASLANAPLADGFALGDRVTIDRTLIVDWGYFKGNVMQGNFTTRVMLDKMPADQAASVRNALGW
jgi:uncharacterized protein YegJ (DUF2314 family)